MRDEISAYLSMAGERRNVPKQHHGVLLRKVSALARHSKGSLPLGGLTRTTGRT